MADLGNIDSFLLSISNFDLVLCLQTLLELHIFLAELHPLPENFFYVLELFDAII